VIELHEFVAAAVRAANSKLADHDRRGNGAHGLRRRNPQQGKHQYRSVLNGRAKRTVGGEPAEAGVGITRTHQRRSPTNSEFENVRTECVEAQLMSLPSKAP